MDAPAEVCFACAAEPCVWAVHDVVCAAAAWYHSGVRNFDESAGDFADGQGRTRDGFDRRAENAGCIARSTGAGDRGARVERVVCNCSRKSAGEAIFEACMDFSADSPNAWLEVLGVYLWGRGPFARNGDVFQEAGFCRGTGIWNDGDRFAD